MTIIECIESIMRDCYNPELKSRFIKENFSENVETFRDYYLTFKAFADYERMFSRDLMLFTNHQLMAAFESMMSTPSVFEERYRQIKNYCSYNKKTPPIITFGELDMSESVRRNSIRDIDELRFILNICFQPDAEETLDVMRKTCIILLYLGINKNNIVTVRKTDIDCDKGEIFIESQNRVLNFFKYLPDDFMDTIRLCKSMTSYKTLNPRHRFESAIKSLQESDLLIRGDASRIQNKPTLFVEKIFANPFENVNKDLTPTRVMESGYYNWMFQNEGKDEYDLARFREATEEFFYKPIKKYMHYFQNYISWKRAYY